MNGFQDASVANGRCCLLVTDAQHDFCEGALPAPGGLPVVQRIGETLQHLKRCSILSAKTSASDPDAQPCGSGSARNVDSCREVTSEEMIRSISSEPTGGSEQHGELETWCDMVVFSLDWHPPDHVSFLSSHSEKCVHGVCVCGNATLSASVQQAASAAVDEATASLGLDKDWTVVVPSPCSENAEPSVVRLWPPHCVQNTPGSKLHSAIKVHIGDFAVFKGGNSSVRLLSHYFAALLVFICSPAF